MSQAPSKASSKLLQNLHLILLGLSVVVLVVLAVLLFSRMNSIDGRLSELSQEWDKASEEISQSSQRSEQAINLARRAEQEANLAAVQRDSAERQRQLAEQETERERQHASEVQGELEKLKQEKEEQLRNLERDLSKIAETRRTALGLVLNLGSDVMKFDFDKAELKPEHKELLSRIVGILLTQEGYGVYVYGHTDNVGTAEYNMDLSERRAKSVRDYLVEAGIDPSIITTKGFGQTRPLVKGSSPEARAKNRRVEIGVINTRINYERSIP